MRVGCRGVHLHLQLHDRSLQHGGRRLSALRAGLAARRSHPVGHWQILSLGRDETIRGARQRRESPLDRIKWKLRLGLRDKIRVRARVRVSAMVKDRVWIRV